MFVVSVCIAVALHLFLFYIAPQVILQQDHREYDLAQRDPVPVPLSAPLLVLRLHRLFPGIADPVPQVAAVETQAI